MNTTGYSKKNRLFDRNSQDPFKLSRSKIDLFLECPRCFYLDRCLGVARPDTYPLTLNIAVDHLLKKEFDAHRMDKRVHPFMEQFGIDAIPFDHPQMNIWRENFVGIQYVHKPTNLLIFGAVDDIWVNPKGELIVVDYKATAKSTTPTLDGDLGAQYKRQMEVYQWLLKQNGFPVCTRGYFVYLNGKKDREGLDGRLEFDVHVIPCEGSPAWIEEVLIRAKETLMSQTLPPMGSACKYCPYRDEAGRAIRKIVLAESKKSGPQPESQEIKTTLF